MSTEVKHGPDPKWTRPVSGEFSCRIVGHYTDTPDLAAAGVAEFSFQSDRPIKRRAELLALRTAMKDWFEKESLALGFAPEGAYRF